MPCCIGIIRYAQCRHSTLYKLGCTAECRDLCPTGQQEVLLRTRFRWCCEECHGLQYTTEADARSDEWNDRARRIVCGRGGAADDDDEREMRVLALRDREEFEEQLLEEQRLAQVEEIQYAEQWTCEYGRAVFALRHGLQRERPRRRRRWPFRRRCRWLDEDEQPTEAEMQAEPDDDDDDDDDDDGEDDADAAAAASIGAERAELEQHLQQLRSLQQWDLAVLQDASRSSKELCEQRERERLLLRRGAHGAGAAAAAAPKKRPEDAGGGGGGGGTATATTTHRAAATPAGWGPGETPARG